MSGLLTTLKVSETRRLEHCWPKAPKHRKYLSFPHPHNFRFSVSIKVTDHDREVEFHDLGDSLRSVLDSLEKYLKGRGKSMSCEHMASYIMDHFRGSTYIVQSVTVAEDECHEATIEKVNSHG